MVNLDNRYISATFARYLIHLENKVKIHGVTRKYNRGIPKCIMQTQLQNSKMADKQRNTVKVAVLDGDSAVKDLVAIFLWL